MTELRDYRGALHVHSRYSDGSGPVDEIVAAAQAAGLDLLLIADHNTLAARTEGWVAGTAPRWFWWPTRLRHPGAHTSWPWA